MQHSGTHLEQLFHEDPPQCLRVAVASLECRAGGFQCRRARGWVHAARRDVAQSPLFVGAPLCLAGRAPTHRPVGALCLVPKSLDPHAGLAHAALAPLRSQSTSTACCAEQPHHRSGAAPERAAAAAGPGSLSLARSLAASSSSSRRGSGRGSCTPPPTVLRRHRPAALPPLRSIENARSALGSAEGSAMGSAGGSAATTFGDLSGNLVQHQLRTFWAARGAADDDLETLAGTTLNVCRLIRENEAGAFTSAFAERCAASPAATAAVLWRIQVVLGMPVVAWVEWLSPPVFEMDPRQLSSALVALKRLLPTTDCARVVLNDSRVVTFDPAALAAVCAALLPQLRAAGLPAPLVDVVLEEWPHLIYEGIKPGELSLLAAAWRVRISRGGRATTVATTVAAQLLI